jgi:hypothetical protein
MVREVLIVKERLIHDIEKHANLVLYLESVDPNWRERKVEYLIEMYEIHKGVEVEKISSYNFKEVENLRVLLDEFIFSIKERFEKTFIKKIIIKSI